MGREKMNGEKKKGKEMKQQRSEMVQSKAKEKQFKNLSGRENN